MSRARHPVDNLSAISVFVRIGESPNLATAARRLGLSPSGVSKALARLEERLGVRLVNRTTHNLSLTEEGAQYFARCQAILAELEDAEAALNRAGAAPKGRLRVLLPHGFGRKIVLPALADFLDRYPRLRIDVELSDRPANLAEEGIDVAVRVGEAPDQRVMAKTLCRMRYVICASPAYLRQHGEPMEPADLATHRCLTLVRPHTGRYREWDIIEGAGDIVGTLNVNDIQGLVDAAIAGAGILYATGYMIWEALLGGQLKVILPQHGRAGPPLTALYLPNRHHSPRVGAFLEFLTQLVTADPPWEQVLAQMSGPCVGGRPTP